jgi:CelD/BcsL family acetyltransferase involved in cellulose biosynthesis
MTSELRSVGRGPSATGVAVRLEPVDPERLAELWRALEPRCEASFFQSWGWIGCWLRHLPPAQRPLAVIAAGRDRIVGLGVAVPGPGRLGLVPGRVLRLHECGAPELDALFIEHNGFVVDRDHGAAVWAAGIEALLDRDGAAELHLGGLAARTADTAVGAACALALEVVVRARRPAARLDLAPLRQHDDPVAATLGRNARYQLRRARRLYQRIGPLRLRAAQDAGEALSMLDRLKDLHQRTWRRRGQPGCFANPAFETFHRDLIRDRFASGAIRLLCASAGGRPFGYLYDFAHGARVYAYQSGLDYDDDGRLKPGLVSHALAIEQALAEGFSVYDFMAGANRLKASFASHSDHMLWIAIRRPSLRTRFRRRLGVAPRQSERVPDLA